MTTARRCPAAVSTGTAASRRDGDGGMGIGIMGGELSPFPAPRWCSIPAASFLPSILPVPHPTRCHPVTRWEGAAVTWPRRMRGGAGTRVAPFPLSGIKREGSRLFTSQPGRQLSWDFRRVKRLARGFINDRIVNGLWGRDRKDNLLPRDRTPPTRPGCSKLRPVSVLNFFFFFLAVEE